MLHLIQSNKIAFSQSSSFSESTSCITAWNCPIEGLSSIHLFASWLSQFTISIKFFSLTTLGAHVRTGSTAVQQTFNLKQLFSHESFSMQHLRNDIALLQLDRPATLSSKVNTVCLPTKGSKVAPGTRCFITGNVFFHILIYPHLYIKWGRF